MTGRRARDSGAYHDPRTGAWTVSVLPGRHAVIEDRNGALTTLLGSCVSACIRDVSTGIGGLNHFLLPGDEQSGGASASQAGSARYGIHAMELLVNGILSRGGRKEGLEAKVFGGANVIDVSARETVGGRNVEFVRTYLSEEGIPLAAADVGGALARRIHFFPGSGETRVLRLPPAQTSTMSREEARLGVAARLAPRAGGVELF